MLKKWFIAAALLLIAAGCGSEEAEPVNGSDGSGEKQVAPGGLAVLGEAKPGKESVHFTVTLTNNGDKEAEIEFTSGQKFEVTVADPDGNEIYRYSDGRMFTQALETITLKPGESKSWSDEWKTEQAPAGNYKAALSVTASKINGKEVDPESLTIMKTFMVE